MSYNTLVMTNPAYVAGALVVAESLRRVGSQFPLYLMHSDVELPADVLKHFTPVEVPLIEFKTNPMRTKKQQAYYPWISKSYTKLQFLNPQFIPTEKTVHLDADMMFIGNTDDLITDPRETWGCFANSWLNMPSYKHGEIVNPAHIRRGITSSSAFMGCMLVDKPSEAKYNLMLENLKFNPYGFGNSKCYSGPDEQLWALTQLDSRTNVHHIDPGYTLPVGKENSMKIETPIKSYQWYHTKPWNVDPAVAKYDDIRDWWAVADALSSRDPTVDRFLRSFIVEGQRC